MSKPNLLYKAMKASWMLDPVTAISAAKVLETMIGAARLKAAYPAIEYVEDEDEYEVERRY